MAPLRDRCFIITTKHTTDNNNLINIIVIVVPMIMITGNPGRSRSRRKHELTDPSHPQNQIKKLQDNNDTENTNNTYIYIYIYIHVCMYIGDNTDDTNDTNNTNNATDFMYYQNPGSIHQESSASLPGGGRKFTPNR